MVRLFNGLMILISFLFFIGCAAAPATGPLFTPVTDTPNGNSVLYIYRPYHEIGNAVWPEVFINELKTVSLLNQGYTHLKLKPGKYRVRTEKCQWLSGMGDNIRTEFEIGPNETIYLKYDEKFKYKQGWGQSPSGIVPMKDFEVIYEKWIVIDQGVAIEEIKKCRYIIPDVKDLSS